MNDSAIRNYKGCSISPMARNSWGGKWEAYCAGEFLAADTLAGLKQLINETLAP